jgi:hypothetical protein
MDEWNQQALQLHCPTCAATKGQPCTSYMVGQGGRPQALDKYTHLQRRLAAMQLKMQRQGG